MKGQLLVVNVAVTLSLLPAFGVMGQALAQDPPVAKFRSSIDVVSVSAIVRDRRGRFVGNLERKDFVVAEAGQARPILDFRAQSDGPVKLALPLMLPIVFGKDADDSAPAVFTNYPG